MGSKAKKPAAVVTMPPQIVADDAKRTVRAAVAAPARGYYDAFAALSRENFDAVLKANTAWAEGFEAIANETVVYARQTLAATGTATKELLAARTLDRVIEIHAGLATSALEALVERTARLSELGLALARGTWAPIGGCVETTLTKLTRPVAA
ncbi:MAG: phasin family protein [Alphaproteobacteria bacterium]|nr:phasin family protein [Alphaproteobacteria bacterium]